MNPQFNYNNKYIHQIFNENCAFNNEFKCKYFGECKCISFYFPHIRIFAHESFMNDKGMVFTRAEPGTLHGSFFQHKPRI